MAGARFLKIKIVTLGTTSEPYGTLFYLSTAYIHFTVNSADTVWELKVEDKSLSYFSITVAAHQQNEGNRSQLNYVNNMQ